MYFTFSVQFDTSRPIIRVKIEYLCLITSFGLFSSDRHWLLGLERLELLHYFCLF